MATQIRTANFAQLFSAGVEAEPAPSVSVRRRRRNALLEQSLTNRFVRILNGVVHMCHPRRIAALPGLIDFTFREWLVGASTLPDPESALARPDGLCALAGDVSADTLLDAYARGLSPRGFIGFETFWSPAERQLFDLKSPVSGDAGRAFSQSGGTFSFDQDFDLVIAACAKALDERASPVSLSPAILHGFAQIYDMGFAHSFEMRDSAGRLTAGGFGVAAGRVFAVEGLFERVPGALAAGLALLNRHLTAWGYVCTAVNCAMEAQGGLILVPRARFNALLTGNLGGGKFGRWRAGLDVESQEPRVMSRFRRAA